MKWNFSLAPVLYCSYQVSCPQNIAKPTLAVSRLLRASNSQTQPSLCLHAVNSHLWALVKNPWNAKMGDIDKMLSGVHSHPLRQTASIDALSSHSPPLICKFHRRKASMAQGFAAVKSNLSTRIVTKLGNTACAIEEECSTMFPYLLHVVRLASRNTSRSAIRPAFWIRAPRFSIRINSLRR